MARFFPVIFRHFFCSDYEIIMSKLYNSLQAYAATIRVQMNKATTTYKSMARSIKQQIDAGRITYQNDKITLLAITSLKCRVFGDLYEQAKLVLNNIESIEKKQVTSDVKEAIEMLAAVANKDPTQSGKEAMNLLSKKVKFDKIKPSMDVEASFEPKNMRVIQYIDEIVKIAEEIGDPKNLLLHKLGETKDRLLAAEVKKKLDTIDTNVQYSPQNVSPQPSPQISPPQQPFRQPPQQIYPQMNYPNHPPQQYIQNPNNSPNSNYYYPPKPQNIPQQNYPPAQQQNYPPPQQQIYPPPQQQNYPQPQPSVNAAYMDPVVYPDTDDIEPPEPMFTPPPLNIPSIPVPAPSVPLYPTGTNNYDNQPPKQIDPIIPKPSPRKPEQPPPMFSPRASIPPYALPRDYPGVSDPDELYLGPKEPHLPTFPDDDSDDQPADNYNNHEMDDEDDNLSLPPENPLADNYNPSGLSKMDDDEIDYFTKLMNKN